MTSNNNSIGPGQIGPINHICDGVYTAEGIATTGEKIYFAIETIENKDKKKWILYKNAASTIVNGECCGTRIGSLVEIGSRVNTMAELNEFLSTLDRPDYWSADPAKFKQLCDKLKERKISKDSSKAKELAAIPHASNGVNVETQTHMIYVSKTPITGRIEFASSSKGFRGYTDKYENLLMSVGVTVKDVVENRGIFRNPLSVVEGGYAGLAMMMHSFTCMAVKEIQPEVKSFRVRPLKMMGEIFLKSLPKDKVTVNGIRGDIYDQGFETEQDVRVPVEILAQLHRAG